MEEKKPSKQTSTPFAMPHIPKICGCNEGSKNCCCIIVADVHLLYGTMLLQLLGQIFPELEGLHPAHPGNSCLGLGPSSPDSTCLVFPAYRDVPLGLSKVSVNGEFQLNLPLHRCALEILQDMSQTISEVCLCKWGTCCPMFCRMSPLHDVGQQATTVQTLSATADLLYLMMSVYMRRGLKCK